MPMEESLITRLTAVTAISDLAGDRVSWFARQRGDSVPVIAMVKISPGRDWTHDGPDGLDRPRVRFDYWAATGDQVIALQRATQAEMETTADVDGTRFHPGMLQAERWIDEGEQDGGEGLFRLQQEFLFYHEEID